MRWSARLPPLARRSLFEELGWEETRVKEVIASLIDEGEDDGDDADTPAETPDRSLPPENTLVEGTSAKDDDHGDDVGTTPVKGDDDDDEADKGHDDDDETDKGTDEDRPVSSPSFLSSAFGDTDAAEAAESGAIVAYEHEASCWAAVRHFMGTDIFAPPRAAAPAPASAPPSVPRPRRIVRKRPAADPEEAATPPRAEGPTCAGRKRRGKQAKRKAKAKGKKVRHAAEGHPAEKTVELAKRKKHTALLPLRPLIPAELRKHLRLRCEVGKVFVQITQADGKGTGCSVQMGRVTDLDEAVAASTIQSMVKLTHKFLENPSMTPQDLKKLRAKFRSA